MPFISLREAEAKSYEEVASRCASCSASVAGFGGLSGTHADDNGGDAICAGDVAEDDAGLGGVKGTRSCAQGERGVDGTAATSSRHRVTPRRGGVLSARSTLLLLLCEAKLRARLIFPSTELASSA